MKCGGGREVASAGIPVIVQLQGDQIGSGDGDHELQGVKLTVWKMVEAVAAAVSHASQNLRRS